MTFRGTSLVIFSLVVFLGTGFFLLFHSPIRAQETQLEFSEASLVPESELETEPEFSASSSDLSVTPEAIQAATTRYFAAVETYRIEENRYNLARDQYYQLNTLTALDEAIRRSKEVLRARSEVLHAYFSYLRLILENTKGIEINDKINADLDLVRLQEDLETYVLLIPNAQDRQQVNVLFENLNSRSREIQSAAYGTLMLIKIGEIQTAADTAGILQQRTQSAIEQSETLSAAEVEISTRGMSEISLLLQRANNNTFTLLENYRQQKSRGNFSESGYRSFQSNAEFSYLQLRQVVDYLREIQQGL